MNFFICHFLLKINLPTNILCSTCIQFRFVYTFEKLFLTKSTVYPSVLRTYTNYFKN